MNRKQWFVLGIGLILMSFFYAYTADTLDCDEIQAKSFTSQLENIETGMNIQDVKALSMEAWIISCMDDVIEFTNFYVIFLSLGIIFVILGFLEPKSK